MTNDLGETLIGSVRTIRVENARLPQKGNKHIEGSRALKQEVTYDTQRRKTVEINYGSDDTISVRRVFNYDVGGQLKEVVEYKADGSLIGRKAHIREGNSIKEVSYKGDGTLDPDTVINTLDNDGRQIGVERFGGENSLPVKAVITYREEGKIVEVVMCTGKADGGMIVPGGGGGSVIVSDAEKDKMKGIPPCSDGLFISRAVFTLDDAGHIAESATYTSDNSLVGKQIYAREFDARGNWIKEIMSSWNAKSKRFQKSHTRYRTITYY